MYQVKLSESYFPPQHDATIRDITIGELLKEIAELYPKNIALIDIDENGQASQSWSYSELLAEAKTLSGSLSSRFQKGEKLVVWAPNIPQWIFMEYACALSGIVLVTANPSFQTNELKYVIEQSGAVGLFLVSEYRGNQMDRIAKAATDGNINLREVVDLYDLESLYLFKKNKSIMPLVKPDDPAQIQYTSGTTGFPKGAVLSHKSLVNNAKIYSDRKQVTQSSVWSNFMPLFHTAGCATGTLGCLSSACKMLLIKQFNADIFAKLIEEQKVTTCFAVPTMLFGLLESLDKRPRDMSSLKVVSTGGSPVPPELVERVRKRLGCHLLSAFGQTEHSPMISLNPFDATVEQIVKTAGQPLPETEVSIRSIKNNDVLPIGEVGEICARSYAVMTEYNDNPEATQSTVDDNFWLHTGDLGTMDENGFLRITGRVKDMIIRGGENHFPAEIEASLITHPEIMQVAVVGLPDQKWGEVIAAFFTAKTTPSKKALREHCKSNMSPQKTPSVWVRVSGFPLTGSGKIQKFNIVEKYLSGNYGNTL
jgi:fatty-acyl-CoA synthase